MGGQDPQGCREQAHQPEARSWGQDQPPGEVTSMSGIEAYGEVIQVTRKARSAAGSGNATCKGAEATQHRCPGECKDEWKADGWKVRLEPMVGSAGGACEPPEGKWASPLEKWDSASRWTLKQSLMPGRCLLGGPGVRYATVQCGLKGSAMPFLRENMFYQASHSAHLQGPGPNASCSIPSVMIPRDLQELLGLQNKN